MRRVESSIADEGDDEQQPLGLLNQTKRMLSALTHRRILLITPYYIYMGAFLSFWLAIYPTTLSFTKSLSDDATLPAHFGMASLVGAFIGLSQYKFDSDSFIISTAHFQYTEVDIHLNDGDYNVYATSADPVEKQSEIQIVQRQDVGKETRYTAWKLNELYHHVDGNGVLLKGTPLVRTIVTSTITVTDNGKTPCNAVLFFIKKEKDESPVYDATNSTISIQTDAQWAWKAHAVTFLNAKPFFTLSNFGIGTAANLRVHATPYHLTHSVSYPPLIDISRKEYATNSFVPIIGPIATVSVVKFDMTKSSFSVSSDTKDWFKAPFSPGSQIAISSPGFISMSLSTRLPHFFSSDRLVGDWKTSRDTALTVVVDAINLGGNSTLKFLAEAGNMTVNVGTSEKLSLSAMEFQLDYDISNPDAMFLIQTTSGGNIFSTNIVVLTMLVLLPNAACLL